MVLISSVQFLLTFARKRTFSTVPLAPDLLFDGQNFFNLFNTGSCKVFGILLQYIPHVAAAKEGTGSFPSILFQDNCFQVANSPVNQNLTGLPDQASELF